MSGSLGWKFSRLRRMGRREIGFRVIRQFYQIIEKGRVARGWKPAPRGCVTHQQSLFPAVDEYIHLWKRRYFLDEVGLVQLMSGSMELFGHNTIGFGDPIDWHKDPVSGVRAPVIYGKSINYRDIAQIGDVKVIWELGRQHHLIPLAAAFAITGEERYLQVIVRHIDSWIDQNPFGLGIHWCSALELALRLITWATVHSLVVSRNGGNGLFDVVRNPRALGDAVYQQVWFIRRYFSRHSSAANHLFGELAGVWMSCNVFNLGEEGELWKREAHEELERELQLQVYSDGVDKEQAIYYHLWMLEYALLLFAAGLRFGTPFSAAFGERVISMANYVRDVTPEHGSPPQIGDADDGFVTRFSAAWPEDPYKEVLDTEALTMSGFSGDSSLAEKAFWYGLIGGGAGELTEYGRRRRPSLRSYPRVYEEGGYAVLGNKVCHLVFDAGPLGYLAIAGHGHADALGFTMAIDGNWWLVDPGTFVYHSKPEWRDYFRSTRAHNCLVVDGRDQSTMSGPFMWSRHANARLVTHGRNPMNKQWAKGCHDGYEDIDVLHCREIQFDPVLKLIDIKDTLEGVGNHRIELWFHCAPDVECLYESETTNWVLRKSGTERVVRLETTSEFAWDVFKGQETPSISGWYSSKLGFREPSCTLRGYADCTMPKCITTRILYE